MITNIIMIITRRQKMEKLLNTKEAANLIGVTYRYLLELIKRGEIAIVRIGKRAIRIREADLQRWVESNIEKRARHQASRTKK